MIYRLLEILNLFEFRSGPSRVIGKKEIAYLDVVSSKFRRQLADRQKAVLYDQITTSSENRDCSAEQHTSPIFRIKAKDLFFSA